MVENIKRKVFRFLSEERNFPYVFEAVLTCIEHADKTGILEDIELEDLGYMVNLLYMLLCENSRKYYNKMDNDSNSSELCIPESYVFHRGEDPNEYKSVIGRTIGADLFHEDNKIYTARLLYLLQNLGLLTSCVTSEGKWEDGDARYKVFLFLNYDNLYCVYENCKKSMRTAV